MVKHDNSKYFLITGSLCLFLCAIIITNLVPGLSPRRQAGAAPIDKNLIHTIVPDSRTRTPYKILHIMSYHTPWEWTDTQMEGFKTALAEMPVEYHLIQMDTKRNSDDVWKRTIIAHTQQTILEWKPDLVYASDDEAQRYITRKYINTDIPFVFSAVNAEPEEYGFIGAANITGVLERMHFTATLRLLKQLVPNAQTAVLISDSGAMGPGMIEQLKKCETDVPDIQITGYDIAETYKEFQEKILAYQTQVDAIGFLGNFEFKNDAGQNVPQAEVMRWVLENNRLPDFSFWKDRVCKGTLCAVAVSGYAQGYEAGLLARGILTGGKKPAMLPMVTTTKGVPMINLQTARRLGIHPAAETLLAAEVIQKTVLE